MKCPRCEKNKSGEFREKYYQKNLVKLCSECANDIDKGPGRRSVGSFVKVHAGCRISSETKEFLIGKYGTFQKAIDEMVKLAQKSDKKSKKKAS